LLSQTVFDTIKQKGGFVMQPIRNENHLISHDKVVNIRKISGLHIHTNHELYYLIDGKTKYFVDDEVYVLEKGDLIFIPSNTLHNSDSEDTLYNERIVLAVPDDIFNNGFLSLLDNFKNNKLIHIPHENLYIVEKLLNKIEKEYKKNKEYKDILIRTYTLELLTLICRHRKNTIDVSSSANKMITQVSDYIRSNFNANITLGELSRIFSISESYLSRSFKKEIGIGIGEYITYLRITNAESLLVETNLSLTEIAHRSGFNDSNYFSAVFKRFTDHSPYKYRKMYSKK
jgi:AraC-like DNA-binding protein